MIELPPVIRLILFSDCSLFTWSPPPWPAPAPLPPSGFSPESWPVHWIFQNHPPAVTFSRAGSFSFPSPGFSPFPSPFPDPGLSLCQARFPFPLPSPGLSPRPHLCPRLRLLRVSYLHLLQVSRPLPPRPSPGFSPLTFPIAWFRTFALTWLLALTFTFALTRFLSFTLAITTSIL